MAPISLREIYLLLVPIQATNRSSGFSVPFALAQFVHWGIEVDGIVHEVTGEKTGEGKKFYTVKSSPYKEWRERPGRRGNTIRRRIVGMTDFTDKELEFEARYIWKTRFGNTYKVDTQNCQNFAYVFYKRICAGKDDSRITRADRRSFRPFPRRLTRFKELAVQRTCIAVAWSAIANPEAWVLYGAATVLPLFLWQCKDKKYLKKESKADDAYLEQLYQGYNIDMVDDIADWGFEVEDVVATLQELGYRRRGGRYLHLNEPDWAELDDALHEKLDSKARYEGYNVELVDGLADEEFSIEEVVATLQELGFGKRDTDLADDEWEDVVEALEDKADAADHRHARIEGAHNREDSPLRIGY